MKSINLRCSEALYEGRAEGLDAAVPDEPNEWDVCR